VNLNGGSACARVASGGSANELDMPRAEDTKATIAAIPKRISRGNNGGIAFVPPDRHLRRAKDLADARYSEPLGVDDMARAAGLSRAHFSRQFRKAFGEPPHAYLLTRRLERAAAMLRTTDRSVSDICFSVGLRSLGSFTTSFTRMFEKSPAAYRASFPPAVSRVVVPSCVVRAYGRPQHRPAERG
jgi:AraC-like DNA-binding protein